MGTASSDVILFDTDGTIHCGTSHREARPGIAEMIRLLARLGFSIHMWSARGAAWARESATLLELDEVVTGFHTKTSFPMERGDVIDALGFEPLLIIDDDPDEAVRGIAFFRLRSWLGTHGDGTYLRRSLGHLGPSD